ncbi:MAG: hypothetical protein AAB803_02295 [Patescibacteria group bacterium]
MMIALRRLFRTYKGMIPAVLLLIFSVGGFVYGVVPAGRIVWRLVSEREGVKREVAGLRKKSQTLGGLDEETLRSQLTLLISAVPSDKSIPTVFTTVEEVARESGIGLTAVSVANPGALATESAKKQSTQERKLGSGIVPVSVSGEGTIDQIRDFFKRAVSVRRLLRIRFFDVTFLSSDRAVVHAGLDTFFSPMSTTIGDVQALVEPLTNAEEMTLTKVSGFPAGNIETSAELPLSPSTRDPFSL